MCRLELGFRVLPQGVCQGQAHVEEGSCRLGGFTGYQGKRLGVQELGRFP